MISKRSNLLPCFSFPVTFDGWLWMLFYVRIVLSPKRLSLFHRCDEDCPVGCKGFQSNQHCFQNKTCREGCDVDYWGPTCDPCSPGCMDLLPTQTSNCNVTDGVCTVGCKAGAYGLTCWENCPSECKNNVCNRTSGECLEKCNTGYYGNYCNNTCSDNCQENDCFQGNGSCVGEKCLGSEYVAWYGPSCEDRCPANCLDKVCDRDTGSCTNGCIEGYFGEKCLNGLYVCAFVFLSTIFWSNVPEFSLCI